MRPFEGLPFEGCSRLYYPLLEVSCHGSHPNAVESLGVFRNNFCIVKNLDFVLKYSVYSAINIF